MLAHILEHTAGAELVGRIEHEVLGQLNGEGRGKVHPGRVWLLIDEEEAARPAT